MPTLRIFKYPFEVADQIMIPMPEGAKILDIQMQHDVPCIWALVNPNALYVTKVFRLAGTGHPIELADEAKYTYVGTFQMAGGSLIFHLFEIKEDAPDA